MDPSNLDPSGQPFGALSIGAGQPGGWLEVSSRRFVVETLRTTYTFEEYLDTLWFLGVTGTTLDRYDHCCAVCGHPATKAVHVSHERLGEELPEDTIAVCERDTGLNVDILRHFQIPSV